MSARVLTAALGDYPHTAALPDSPLVRLERIPVKPISRAFAPMVREARYDVSEMAIATFLMAKAAGIPITLLPVVMAARFQEGALLCRADGPIRGPADLLGRRVGVRAYSQTTGMWLRGVLAERHGVAADGIAWTTFEDAHVPGFRDPPSCTRAAPGADMTAMVRAGELDAAIFGAELPPGYDLRPVFPDVVFCPTGGIRRDDVGAYLKLSNCPVVGGSWVVPPVALRDRDWTAITALARAASERGRGAERDGSAGHAGTAAWPPIVR